MKKIKPVVRYVGSKYRKIQNIFNYLPKKNMENYTYFIDVFGGTGIVGVNFKNNFDKKIVFINDYDNIFPLTNDFIKKNLSTYNGDGKYYTKLAIESFNRRVKNGLWEKVKIYNDIINRCNITHLEYKELVNKLIDFADYENKIWYFDPPYFKDKGKIYKINDIDFNEFVETIKAIPKNHFIMISINKTPEIVDIFTKMGFIINEIEFAYCSTKNRHKEIELLITNKEEK